MKETGDAATSTAKDEELRRYNIGVEKRQTQNRFACDTISLQEYILEAYEPGTYLVEFDKMGTFSTHQPGVIYFNDDGKNYILSIIARSKHGERNIERKNVVGFESSFITLDSTTLGTAFFWLTLFECKDEQFNMVWEAEVPIHGGLNRMTIKNWRPKNIKYVELNYQDGIISGHRNYNFFLINGWQNPPHLLETYVGIVHKRVMANVNNDVFPDYYEYRFLEDSLRIRVRDSIPFFWNEKRQLYVTNVNPRWFRRF